MHQTHPAKDAIIRWLTLPVEVNPVHDTGFKRGMNYLDATNVQNRRLHGHVAVQFYRVVVIDQNATYRDGEKLAEIVEYLAGIYGFRPFVTKSSTIRKLRSAMDSEHFTSAKRFAGNLPQGMRHLFPDLEHDDPAIVRARIANAYRWRGTKTHARVNHDQSMPVLSANVVEYYESADDAMIALLSSDPGRNRIIEIGG